MTAAFLCGLWQATCSPAQLEVLDELLEVSDAEKADPILVAAVSWAESRWHADRVSRCGASGPLGVLPVWLSRAVCHGRTLVRCGVRLLILGRATCGQWKNVLGWFHTGRCCSDGYARRIWRQYRRATAKAARKVIT